MNLLTINGSAKGKNSNTEHLLQAFLSGSEQAGARIETIYKNGRYQNLIF